MSNQRNGLSGRTWLPARTTHPEIRLANQLISPKSRPAKSVAWERPFAGPALPPVEVPARLARSLGDSFESAMETAWAWRNGDVVPERDDRSVRFLRESELQELEKVAPMSAAIARQQAQDARAFQKHGKPTNVIAQLHQLIVDQYGWPERD